MSKYWEGRESNYEKKKKKGEEEGGKKRLGKDRYWYEGEGPPHWGRGRGGEKKFGGGLKSRAEGRASGSSLSSKKRGGKGRGVGVHGEKRKGKMGGEAQGILDVR